jgi:hypothetical protein
MKAPPPEAESDNKWEGQKRLLSADKGATFKDKTGMQAFES